MFNKKTTQNESFYFEILATDATGKVVIKDEDSFLL